MASLLDPWIDAEQRYAEDDEFRRAVDGLDAWLQHHGLGADDLRQATMVIVRQRGMKVDEPQVVGP